MHNARHRHRSPAERAAAVDRVLIGHETPRAVAETLRVTPAAVRKWIAQAQRNGARAATVPHAATPGGVAPNPNPIPTASEETPPGDPAHEPEGLAEALAALGPPSSSTSSTAANDPGPDAERAGAGEAPASSSTSSADSFGLGATPDGAQLVALLQLGNALVIRAACASAKYKPTPDELAELVRFTPDELDALRFLAPYAARFAPVALEKAPKLAALAFLAFYGFTVKTRVDEIKDRAALARARAVPAEPVAA